MSQARRRFILQLIVAAAMLHGRVTPSAAQSSSEDAPEQPRVTIGPDVEERPWARGVSEEQQQKALAAYDAGTESLKKLQFSTAVASYRDALKRWDHPSIHYHLAVALMNLEQPLDAYHSVLAALRYDGAALHEHERMQALQYKALLQQRLGTFDVSSSESGSTVAIDGEPLLSGVGQSERVTLAGEHQVVVRKRGFVTWSDSLRLDPATRVRIEVQGRREIVSPWVPWAVVGAGAAIGGLGALLHWRAELDMRRFDDNVAKLCAQKPCLDEEPKTKLWLMERAYREQYGAVAAYVAGAGVVIGGLVLAWYNPERSFRLEQRRIPWQPSLVPNVSRTTAGVSVSTSF
jgi:hypothetical protein